MQDIPQSEILDRPDAQSEYIDSKRLKQERSQLITRSLFLFVIAAWSAYYRASDGTAGFAIACGIFLFSVVIIAATFADINKYPKRKFRIFLTVSTDILVTGAFVWLTNVPLSPIFFVFLFIVVSNTMRYGRRMMMFCALLSLGVYGANLIAYVFLDMGAARGFIYWPLEAGKIMSLIIIPLFLDAMLRRQADSQKSIKAITGGLKKYTIGKETLSFNLKRNDELQVLAEHIELLTHKIRVQQDQLYDQALNLQELVTERTSELNEQMRKARESDRLKTQFLNNLSHELRTPLHNIIGFADLLNKQDLPVEKAGKMSLIIGQRANELLEKLEALTTLTCLMTGEQRIAMSPLNIKELMEQTVGRFGEQAGRKSIKLGLGIDIEHPTIVADHKIINEILCRLIDNAIKFTPGGGEVNIDVSLNGQRLNLTVSDKGMGIAEEDQQPIFDLFRQMDGGLNRRFEGLGIGLFIVKLLVNLHKGDIQMESKKGEGSSFAVSIPVSEFYKT
mgnify:CR=1 FL=1